MVSIVLSLIFALVVIYPLYRICMRAGLPWWPAALVLIPVIGPPLIAYILALSRWPTHPHGR